MKVASLIEKVAEASPLVQCITNYVSMDFMANTLLAIGASPAMVALALQHDPSKLCAPMTCMPDIAGHPGALQGGSGGLCEGRPRTPRECGDAVTGLGGEHAARCFCGPQAREALGAGSCRCWRNALQNSGLLMEASPSSALLTCWLALRCIMLSPADNPVPGEAEAHRDPGERL